MRGAWRATGCAWQGSRARRLPGRPCRGADAARSPRPLTNTHLVPLPRRSWEVKPHLFNKARGVDRGCNASDAIAGEEFQGAAGPRKRVSRRVSAAAVRALQTELALPLIQSCPSPRPRPRPCRRPAPLRLQAGRLWPAALGGAWRPRRRPGGLGAAPVRRHAGGGAAVCASPGRHLQPHVPQGKPLCVCCGGGQGARIPRTLCALPPLLIHPSTPLIDMAAPLPPCALPVPCSSLGPLCAP